MLLDTKAWQQTSQPQNFAARKRGNLKKSSRPHRGWILNCFHAKRVRVEPAYTNRPITAHFGLGHVLSPPPTWKSASRLPSGSHTPKSRAAAEGAWRRKGVLGLERGGSAKTSLGRRLSVSDTSPLTLPARHAGRILSRPRLSLRPPAFGFSFSLFSSGPAAELPPPPPPRPLLPPPLPATCRSAAILRLFRLLREGSRDGRAEVPGPLCAEDMAAEDAGIEEERAGRCWAFEKGRPSSLLGRAFSRLPQPQPRSGDASSGHCAAAMGREDIISTSIA